MVGFVYMKHEAWASFSKFSYRYKDKSAVANIGGLDKLFKWGEFGIVLGGDFYVWLGYDVGPIQLDPIYADYYVWFGGFRELKYATLYLLLEHPCFHYIDRLDTLPLYWNAFRLLYRRRDFAVSVGQYLHSDRFKFLAMGTDWGTDLQIFRRFRFKKASGPFAETNVFLALSRNYRKLYARWELLVGWEFRNENGDLTVGLGYRPYDRTGIVRDVEGVLYLKLQMRGH